MKPVSNLQILKIGRATVKFATYLADQISKDKDGNFTKYFLGDRYVKIDKKTKLPQFYGKSIQ